MDFAWSAYCSVGPRTEGRLEKETPKASAASTHHEITFVDKSGERLLRVLVREGAQCIAGGVYIKNVLDKLTAKTNSGTFDRLSGFFRRMCPAIDGPHPC
jgi:hypothetical protein